MESVTVRNSAEQMRLFMVHPAVSNERRMIHKVIDALKSNPKRVLAVGLVVTMLIFAGCSGGGGSGDNGTEAGTSGSEDTGAMEETTAGMSEDTDMGTSMETEMGTEETEMMGTSMEDTSMMDTEMGTSMEDTSMMMNGTSTTMAA